MDNAIEDQVADLFGQSLSRLEGALRNLYDENEDLRMSSQHLLNSSLNLRPFETIYRLVRVMTSEESLSFRLNAAKFLSKHVMIWPNFSPSDQERCSRMLLEQFLVEKDLKIVEELLTFISNLTKWILWSELFSKLHSNFTEKTSDVLSRLSVLRLLGSLCAIPSLELAIEVDYAYNIFNTGLEDKCRAVRLASSKYGLKFLRLSRLYRAVDKLQKLLPKMIGVLQSSYGSEETQRDEERFTILTNMVSDFPWFFVEEEVLKAIKDLMGNEKTRARKRYMLSQILSWIERECSSMTYQREVVTKYTTGIDSCQVEDTAKNELGHTRVKEGAFLKELEKLQQENACLREQLVLRQRFMPEYMREGISDYSPPAESSNRR